LITLLDTSGWKRIDLVVVAPQTDPVTAERVLALAGLDGDLNRAGQILDETQGGRVLASLTVAVSITSPFAQVTACENSPGEPMDWTDPGCRGVLASRIRLNTAR
jgi:hypothetical protein